jgi:hypothetical protein
MLTTLLDYMIILILTIEHYPIYHAKNLKAIQKNRDRRRVL